MPVIAPSLPSQNLPPVYGGPMPEGPAYRAYVIGRDDRFQAAKEIEARDDDEAIEIARHMVDGHAIELWDRARMIIRLPAKTD